MIGADKFYNDLSDEQQNLHTHQRYARGYSDIDMWNFDQFLKDIIVAGLTYHIEDCKGFPWTMERDEWKDILKEIRREFHKGFEELPSRRAWKLLRRHLPSMWD